MIWWLTRGLLAWLPADGASDQDFLGPDSGLNGENATLKLTSKAWELLEASGKTTGSNEVFIAMKFGDEYHYIRDAIQAACGELGWNAERVDGGPEYVGKVTDEMVASIRRCRFMVCDFTGNNQGIYWEAGYGEALGIPVFYTVHEDDIGDVHFDTKDFNHIVWSEQPRARAVLEENQWSDCEARSRDDRTVPSADRGSALADR